MKPEHPFDPPRESMGTGRPHNIKEARPMVSRTFDDIVWWLCFAGVAMWLAGRYC